MFLLFRYPHEKNISFTAFFDRDYYLFWKAADVIRMFGYKNVGKTLRMHLKNEYLSKYKDIFVLRRQSIYKNTLVLDCGQVLRFAENVSPQRRNGTFEKWFKKILDGTQVLYPENQSEYQQFLEHLEKSDATAIGVESVFASADDTTFSTVPPPTESFEEENKKNRRELYPIVEEEEGDGFPEGAESDLSCSSLQVEDASGSDEGIKPIYLRLVFCLPGLVYNLRRRANMSYSIERSLNPRTVAATDVQGITRASVKSNSDFKLEIDDSLNYYLVDSPFKTKYKFYAIKANYSSYSRSISINPYMHTIRNNTYLFFPVKKEEMNF